MFVYNSGKLKENSTYISSTEYIYRLTHITSGMNIEVFVNTEIQNSESPYKVYREENGTYTVYKEFYRNGKTIKENFEEAILYFEDNIYKAMKETPPVDDSVRNDEDVIKPETFKEVPVVGDIVQVGKNYGIVTDVNDKEVTVKSLSKEEAMRILKNQQNAQISTSIENVEMAFGGTLIVANGAEIKGSSFKKYNVDKDNVIILRVKPPKEAEDNSPPSPENNKEQKQPEPVPDNVKDPFEENDKEDQGKNDKKDKDDQGKDSESKDSEKNEEGKDGEDGEDNDGEDDNKNDEGKDGKDSKKNEEGKDGKSGNSEGDDFGDENEEPKQSLEDLMKEIQKSFEEGNSANQIQVNGDIETLERALATPRDKIKETFKTIGTAKAAVGKENIFGVDNENRLNKTLNEIFK